VANFRSVKAGIIIAVKDFDASIEFYSDKLGFEVVDRFDDPPYASLNVAGARLSIAEQGHPSEDLSHVVLTAPSNPDRPSSLIVVEVDNAAAALEEFASRGVTPVAPAFNPPWGGSRFFVADPDGHLVEFEQPA
jgi:catechol 2,3-dioxygenase-like lactoylglutathione lyase family enzyme